MAQAERRLAAVMVTDIVGYTTMAQKDENLALELLEEHRSLLRTQFARHRGREIKSMGDGFLVEFSSAVDAVQCAIDIQQALHSRNAGLSEEGRVLVRIGVHVGDVIDREGDLLGDGMNVASRIEPLARPGGVCVSEQVHSYVWNKIRFPFVSIGEQELKHVSTPVEVYRVVFPWEEQPEVPAERTRLAVLPLVNISPSLEDAYFAEGMTGELIYTLSQLPSLRVIAQTSVMKYKDNRKGVAEIGRELNVGTVIEGSVRKASHRVRIMLQLIDARTEEHLWSEAFDRNLEDVFALQSEIAQQVAEVLQVELLGRDRSRACPHTTPDVEAYMLYLQGRHFWNRRSEDGVRRAIELFEQAIQIDGCYAAAYAGLADTYAVLVNWGYAAKGDALKEARRAAEKAIALDPNLAEAHASLGLVILEEDDDPSRAEEEFHKAIELNPSYAPAHHWLANVLFSTGRTEEALQEMLKALRLDPLSPTIATVAGDFLYHVGRYDEAIAQWRRALELAPGFARARISLAHAHEAVGDWESAEGQYKQAIATDPDSPRPRAEYGEHLLRVGRSGAALEELRNAAEYTSAPFPSHHFGLALVFAGSEDEARSLLDKATAQDDDWPGLRLAVLLADALAGNHDRALQYLDELKVRYGQQQPRLGHEIEGFRGLVEAIAGQYEKARATLKSLEQVSDDVVPKTLVGLMHLWLGESESGFSKLSEAVRQRESLVRMIKALPLPSKTRGEEAYMELLQSLNLPVEDTSRAYSSQGREGD
ncbi:MAG: tetratricopeptide repeat protein [Candidatus Bipolaricaulota bacterium]